MTFSSVAELRELAVVSHPLWEEASREILTRGVDLRSGRTGIAKLQAFCQFMLKHEPPLYPFLHKLVLEHIPNGPSDGFDPSDILEVLSRATYLRDFRIMWCDHLFTTSSDKRLPVILPQLQHLRRLEIWTRRTTTDPLVADTVLHLPAQLHTLQFSSDADNQLPRDFPNLLAARQHSLHRLRICYPNLTNVPWAPFPSLRILHIITASKLPSLPHLTQIFPHLRELTVFAVGFEVDFAHPAPEHVRAREDALAFQRAGGGWRSLDVLTTTTIGDPWVLCLACPVGCVRLGSYDAASHAAFMDVVSRTRPRKVSLHLACAGYCVKPQAEPNIFLFSADPSNKEVAGAEDRQGVTHAVLPFTISSFWPDQTTSAFVVRHAPLQHIFSSCQEITCSLFVQDVISSHIRGSRIEYLHLAFAEFFLSAPETDERALKPRDIHPHSVKIIQNIDVDLLVSGVAAVGTHLRILVLTLATRDQSVWTIERCEGGQKIVRVENTYSAREIIEQEERAYLYTKD